MDDARARLAERIAGEVTLSQDPGGTLKKWRSDFEVSQTDLAGELEVSPSVISDYESGRRESPGTDLVARFVTALLDIDARRGGDHARQFARVLSAGFDSEVVLDLREYSRPVELGTFYDRLDATEVVAGGRPQVSGHTVIDSIRAIAELPSEEFYRLYGQSTNRVLGFTNVTRGESPLVALRVVNPKPNAVLLCGLDEDSLWEHAPELARRDGVSLAVTPLEAEDLRTRLTDIA
ncbi:MAG: helix-turn-helix domain-containing protein [Halodesulfurarchaeum sp.]